MKQVPLSSLHEWDKNPRSITSEGFNRLKSQVELLGQYKPLLTTPDGTVIGGNMRLKVLRELGVESVYVVEVEFFQKEDMLWYARVNGVEQKKRFNTQLDGMMEYSLSDNDRAGFYDMDIMANIMPEFSINWSEYSVDHMPPTNLQDIIDNFSENTIEEDDAPEVSQEPAQSELGKVYQLGRHRLMCGDATTVRDVNKLMGASIADILFTDPPYGYSYESNHQNKHEVLKNDDRILHFLEPALAFTAENAPFYIFSGWQTVDKWIEELKTYELQLKNMIIWKKNNWSMGDLEGAYAGQYEIILYVPKGRVLLKGERDRDVWEFNRVKQDNHPTKKPVELIIHALNNHDGNKVIDLFGGSGSTLIACEQTNRICYMMELEPKYCDVIRKRYAKFIKREEEWEALTPEVN